LRLAIEAIALNMEDGMKPNLTSGALLLAAALVSVPAMAQTTAATHSTTAAPATGRPGDTAATNPSDRNPVMTQMGEARASKVIGSSVYNDRDEKVGSIDDLLIGSDGKMNAVLSVGGFLGMGTKYVEVPYAGLTFGNTQRDSDNRVVLKGATKESLKSQPAYNYYRG
jgi:sporulation protein YlmC with PRC-barrel domain